MVSKAAVERKKNKAAASIARSEDGFVPTPPALAEQLMSYPYSVISELPVGARVLDPGAGTGVLSNAIMEYNRDVRVIAIEPDDGRRAQLKELAAKWDENRTEQGRMTSGIVAQPGTLEQYAAAVAGGPGRARFDAVVMNPPFSQPGKPRLWLSHVVTAFAMLRPGGRLVAIVPHTACDGRGGFYAATKEAEAFGEVLAECGGIDEVAVSEADQKDGFPPKVGVLWMAAPIRRADGSAPWILRPAEGEPYKVGLADRHELNIGPVGIERFPVQEYRDSFDGWKVRTVRFAGTCYSCYRPLWMHDDGRDGAMSWQACSSVDPYDDGYPDDYPTIGLCMECATSDRARANAAEGVARKLWAERARSEEAASLWVNA